jgi:diguanylate cyclase (GGDEF)-like protein
MFHSIDAVAIALVLAGVGLLLASLQPLRQVIDALPAGRTRRLWYLQGALTLFFVAGYLAYAVLSWGQHRHPHSLVVPLVFFFGACFVWLNFTQAMRTALDVRRIALLEQESITDELTGVYNRRYLQRRLQEAFEAARRYGQPLTILLLDIDHFKRINDEHGHAVGDLALRHLGELCLGTVRASDVVARYGGEELLVIAPHTTAAQGAALAERLRQKVESTPLLVHTDGRPRRELRFTLSIGVASLAADDRSCGALFERADRALYRAKASGRNRVCTEVAPAAPPTDSETSRPSAMA